MNDLCNLCGGRHSGTRRSRFAFIRAAENVHPTPAVSISAHVRQSHLTGIAPRSETYGSVPHSIREYVELGFPVEEAIPIHPVRPRLLQSYHYLSQRLCCQQ